MLKRGLRSRLVVRIGVAAKPYRHDDAVNAAFSFFFFQPVAVAGPVRPPTSTEVVRKAAPVEEDLITCRLHLDTLFRNQYQRHLSLQINTKAVTTREPPRELSMLTIIHTPIHNISVLVSVMHVF